MWSQVTLLASMVCSYTAPPPAYPVCSHICKSLLKPFFFGIPYTSFGLPKSYLSSQVYQIPRLHELFPSPSELINPVYPHNSVQLVSVSVCLVLLLIIYLLMYIGLCHLVTPMWSGDRLIPAFMAIYFPLSAHAPSFRIPGGWKLLGLLEPLVIFLWLLRKIRRLFSFVFFLWFTMHWGYCRLCWSRTQNLCLKCRLSFLGSILLFWKITGWWISKLWYLVISTSRDDLNSCVRDGGGDS